MRGVKFPLEKIKKKKTNKLQVKLRYIFKKQLPQIHKNI